MRGVDGVLAPGSRTRSTPCRAIAANNKANARAARYATTKRNSHHGRDGMLNRSAIVLAAALCLIGAGAQAFDDAQYPNLKGQWQRARAPMPNPGQGPFD